MTFAQKQCSGQLVRRQCDIEQPCCCETGPNQHAMAIFFAVTLLLVVSPGVSREASSLTAQSSRCSRRKDQSSIAGNHGLIGHGSKLAAGDKAAGGGHVVFVFLAEFRDQHFFFQGSAQPDQSPHQQAACCDQPVCTSDADRSH